MTRAGEQAQLDVRETKRTGSRSVPLSVSSTATQALYTGASPAPRSLSSTQAIPSMSPGTSRSSWRIMVVLGRAGTDGPGTAGRATET